MNKTLINTAIAGVLGTVSFSASALSNGDTLSITAGGSEVVGCSIPTAVLNTSTGICELGGNPLPGLNVTGQTGSFFILGGGTTNLSGNEGIVLGSIQLASGSHAGDPNGTESPSIDNPWAFSSNTGMHQSVSAITVISDTQIDMAGWSVTWAGIPSIAMGGCSLVAGGCDTDGDGVDDLVNTGIADIVVTGTSYVLDYFANVPVGDPSGFGGAGYTLHLEGEVSAVPVPAAVWLFGSGLLGLVGVARRKKSA